MVNYFFRPCTIIIFWTWSLLETLNHFGPHAFKAHDFNPYLLDDGNCVTSRQTMFQVDS